MNGPKLQLLQICSDEFKQNYKAEWLEKYDIQYWTKSSKNIKDIALLAEEQFDAILADEHNYSRGLFLCLLRILKVGGILAVPSTPNKTPQEWINEVSNAMQYIENSNTNVWLFVKSPKVGLYTLYMRLEKALKENNFLECLNLVNVIESQDPTNSSIPLIRTNIYHQFGLYKEAEKVWDEFYELSRNPSALYFKTLDILAAGDYQRGFALRKPFISPARRTTTRSGECFAPSLELLSKEWNGEPLYNKTLVIWTEFGLGDEIMFAQLAFYLRSLGTKKIILITQTPIVSLMKTHPDIDQVIDRKNITTELGEFDYWIFPHDIMAFVSKPFDLLPKRMPYLFAEENLIAAAKCKFKPSSNLKIGIVWRGDSTHENDHYRSIHDLKYIEQLFQMENIDWYCFQKLCNDDEKVLLKKYNVPNIAEHNQSMLETAADLMHIDCLLAVDTSVIHLAGALGVKAIVLLPYIVDWRWGYSQNTNLWYSQIRSIRNLSLLNHWDDVIDMVKQSLTLMSLAR